MKKNKFSYCQALVRQHDYYRYLTALFLPVAFREHIFALLAFHHEIAKIKEVTSEPMTGLIRLQWWRDALEEIYSEKPIRKHEVVEPLSRAILECSIPQENLINLINAREADVEFQQPQTIEELEEYCYSTASQLLEISANLLAQPTTKELHLYTKHIGIAWGMMGILRNLPYDISKQRIYFPVNLLQEHHLSNRDILEGTQTKSMQAVIEALIERIETHLKQAQYYKKELPKLVQPLFYLSNITRSFCKRAKKCDYQLFRYSLEEPKLPLITKLYWHALF